MNRLIQQWLERIQSYWKQLQPHQRRNLMIISVSLLLTIALLGWFALRPSYVAVFTNLDDVNAGEVTAKLKELKIDSRLEGNTVLVPEQFADQARVQLAMSNLPKTGNVDFDVFNQSNIGGMTENEFNVKYLNALQGSISNTIRSVQGVENAQIHIVMTQDQLFVQKPTQNATASVFLQLKSGVVLTPAQVTGIQQLVSHSVKGLTPDNVSIVDQRGVRLESDGTNDPSSMAFGSKAQDEIKVRKEIESDLQKRLRNGLERLVGFGNVDVVVNADLAFAQSTLEENAVKPVLDGQGLVVSSQKSTETYKNTPTPGGVAGQTTNDPNSPNYKATTGTGSSGDKTNEIKNYENTHVTTKTQGPAFSINKVSVSVVVNGQVNNQLRQDIQKYVANAIGAKNDGTSNADITVLNSSYQIPNNPLQSQAFYQNPWLIGGIVAGLLLLVGAFVLTRRRNKEEEMVVDTPAPIATIPEDTPQQKMKKQLEKIVNQKPDDFVNLLRTWLTEE